MTPATICLLSDARSVHTRRWAAELSRRGLRVHVVSFAAGDVPGAEVHHVPLRHGLKALGLVAALPALRRVLRRIDPAILHAHYVTSYGIAGALAKVAPLVATAWGSDVLVVPQASPVMRRAVRLALARADLVTCVAAHMADTMRALGLAREIAVMPFGVDVTVFHPGRRAAAPDVDVVCTRPCDPIYNVELLIRSLPAVVARHPSLRCVLVGGGADQEAMRALAGSLGVGANVEFAGVVTQDQLATWLGRARVFVSPARSDGNNISLNEGVACGCLPVCTDIPANREWLTDGVNGFLAPVDRPDVMGQRILAALEPDPRYPEWAASNWEQVQRRANWARNVDTMTEHYDRLSGGRTRT